VAGLVARDGDALARAAALVERLADRSTVST